MANVRVDTSQTIVNAPTEATLQVGSMHSVVDHALEVTAQVGGMHAQVDYATEVTTQIGNMMLLVDAQISGGQPDPVVIEFTVPAEASAVGEVNSSTELSPVVVEFSVGAVGEVMTAAVIEFAVAVANVSGDNNAHVILPPTDLVIEFQGVTVATGQGTTITPPVIEFTAPVTAETWGLRTDVDDVPVIEFTTANRSFQIGIITDPVDGGGGYPAETGPPLLLPNAWKCT